MGTATIAESKKNEPTKVGKKLTPEDRQLLRQLAKLWRSHWKRGLKVRWQTGDLLNKRLGPPTERLAHGKRVLKRAAEKLQIAESELSRMRWFAFRFASIDDFEAKHPKVRSWTKVKELLPQLNDVPHSKGEPSSDVGNTEEQSSGVEQDTALIGGFLRSLSTATGRLRQGDVQLDEAGRKKVQEAIQQLLEAVSDRLQIRFSIDNKEA